MKQDSSTIPKFYATINTPNAEFSTGRFGGSLWLRLPLTPPSTPIAGAIC
jgi:hypothetical protein